MSGRQSPERGDDPGRPSFQSFWTRAKQALKHREISFVQDTKQRGETQDASSSQTPQEKAKARRAQVRRAQIEHRQRKANYVRQLEIDVARIRDLIAAAQTETRVLQSENNAIRSRLAAEVVPSQTSRASTNETTDPELPEDSGMSFLDDVRISNWDGITLSLGLDPEMNVPVYQITSMPAENSRSSNTCLKQLDTLNEPEAPYYPFDHLSPEQTQQVINFILALEHICWDHFQPADFQPNIAKGVDPESGHTLMASSLALRMAPESVFEAMRAQPPPPEEPPAALAAALAAAEAEGAQQLPALSWQASGLTLQSLYGLAGSINPPDLDLTPVQAWFELAARYPLEILLRKDVEGRLKKEFVGVVKCPHFGAAIERGAFESIAARVLDPEIVGLGGT